MTIWEQAYNFLKGKGFDVYPPAMYRGDCTNQYIVLKDGGSTPYPGTSTDQSIYELLLYTPQASYSSVEGYTEAVKTSMKGLFPLLKPTGLVTVAYNDTSNKSWMVSIQYVNYKKSYVRR